MLNLREYTTIGTIHTSFMSTRYSMFRERFSMKLDTVNLNQTNISRYKGMISDDMAQELAVINFSKDPNIHENAEAQIARLDEISALNLKSPKDLRLLQISNIAQDDITRLRSAINAAIESASTVEDKHALNALLSKVDGASDKLDRGESSVNIEMIVKLSENGLLRNVVKNAQILSPLKPNDPLPLHEPEPIEDSEYSESSELSESSDLSESHLSELKLPETFFGSVPATQASRAADLGFGSSWQSSGQPEVRRTDLGVFQSLYDKAQESHTGENIAFLVDSSNLEQILKSNSSIDDKQAAIDHFVDSYIGKTGALTSDINIDHEQIQAIRNNQNNPEQILNVLPLIRETVYTLMSQNIPYKNKLSADEKSVFGQMRLNPTSEIQLKHDIVSKLSEESTRLQTRSPNTARKLSDAAASISTSTNLSDVAVHLNQLSQNIKTDNTVSQKFRAFLRSAANTIKNFFGGSENTNLKKPGLKAVEELQRKPMLTQFETQRQSQSNSRKSTIETVIVDTPDNGSKKRGPNQK